MATIRRAIERAAQHTTSRGQSRQAVSPAPSLGLDLVRSATDIGPRHALRLVNFTARHGTVETRPGLVLETDLANESGPILTIREHGERLYASSPFSIWEIESSTAAIARVDDTLGGVWDTATLAGSMVWVNGADLPRLVDASGVWTVANWTPSTAPQQQFRRAAVHRGRLYFAVADSAIIWYGGAGEIAGELTPVDLSLVHSGGACRAIGSLSIDGGAGPDDLAVFVLADGTALMYRGAYPGSDDWALVGRYSLPPLLSGTLIQWGGDLLAITRSGYISLRQYLGSGDVPIDYAGSALSAPIAPMVQEDIGQSGVWHPVIWPDEGLLIVATPGGRQHVMDVDSRAWSEWRGWDVRSWLARLDGTLLVGLLGGRIGRVVHGRDDMGSSIGCSARSGWDFLGTAYGKQLRAARPHLRLGGSAAAVRLSVDTDYDPRSRSSRQVPLEGIGSEWGKSVWGLARWGRGTVHTRSWGRITQSGTAVSFGIEVQIAGAASAEWFATDVRYDQVPGAFR